MNTSISSDQHDKTCWSLSQWLEHLSAIHPNEIDMGLDRIAKVFARLSLDFAKQTVVTVAGTNGKGTTCCLIEQAALLQGQSVAVYSSPHLLDYRERVRINGQMLSEKQHCQGFLLVEQARGDIPLTYFEFSTLAAMVLIQQQQCQLVLLEVGLGGRLDAVNIVDPDIAVITSIDLDHQDWLGDTREKIAIEKAGIIRENIPVVIGEIEPPLTLREKVKRMTRLSYWQGADFRAVSAKDSWQWQTPQTSVTDLPLPNIPLQNASTALKVIELLDLNLTPSQIKSLLSNTQLAGRQQVLQHHPEVMVDVAHNPQASRLLGKTIANKPFQKLRCVVAMLADKDISATLQPLIELDPDWYLASLDVPRGATSSVLQNSLPQNSRMKVFDSVNLAYQEAIKDATDEDLVVVFGSFYTVAAILA